RRILAGLATFAFVLQFSGATALAKSLSHAPVAQPDEQMEAVDLTDSFALDKPLLAHHGGEGATAATTVAGLSAAPAVGVLNAHASKKSYSDSLWGNMLLNMAFARDPELQRLGRRLGQINALTMMSVLGV